MNLQLSRTSQNAKCTLGSLAIDGVFFCYTLEPPVREEKPRAIPEGTYQILIQNSHRFEMPTPHLQNVPEETFIEIHPGNFPKDTEGCILVGFQKGDDAIYSSRAAFNALMLKLSDPIQIEIQSKENP